jgi:hypothetical protein
MNLVRVPVGFGQNNKLNSYPQAIATCIQIDIYALTICSCWCLVITALEILRDALQRKMETCNELNQDLFSKVLQSCLFKIRKLQFISVE